jgi:hypothetical protein
VRQHSARLRRQPGRWRAWAGLDLSGIAGTDVGISPLDYGTGIAMTIGLLLTQLSAAGAIARVGNRSQRS